MLKHRRFALKIPLHNVLISLFLFVTVQLKLFHQMEGRKKW